MTNILHRKKESDAENDFENQNFAIFEEVVNDFGRSDNDSI